MSDTCGNCDCADKSQCVKKGGSSYTADIIATEKSSVSVVVMEIPAAEGGKCKCGSSCSCTSCTCGTD